MAAELIIKINGDIAGFKKSLDDAAKKTEDLEGVLSTMAKASGIAFAALTAEVGFAVKAFGDQEAASNRLSAALVNQGIYSRTLMEDYKAQADAVEALVGVDGDLIIAGQANAQAFLGNIKITKELTQAVVDFAAYYKTDVDSAFQLVAKSIGTNTNALARQGIVVDENASKQEKMRSIIEQITQRMGGQAEAADKGDGVFRRLIVTFGNLQEAIGARFAPAVYEGARRFNELLDAVSKNKVIVDLIASFITAGTVISGLGLVLGGAGTAFLALKAALAAAEIQMSAMTIATRAFVGATGIGLLVLAITEIYLNWNQAWPRMYAAFQAFVDNVGQLGSALAEILKGIFTLDTERIGAGLIQAQEVFANGFDQYKAVVAQKKAEIFEEEKAADDARQAELEARAQTNKQKTLTFEEEVQKELAGIRKSHYDKKVKEETERRVKFEEDEKKFGKSYAAINAAMHSEIYNGTKSAAGELAQLTQSSNSTLKGIGKAAAIANIVIKTAESAMNIFTGFSTIPFVGYALGIAGAAAAIAFGAEQVGKVTAAAQGGLITGGIPGLDSVPAMLMPGELVVPTQNFEEVVSAVAAQRNGDTGQQQTGPIEIVLQLKDNLVEFVEAKMIERQNLNISLQAV